MTDSEKIRCELLIIGTGMAGMAAALFAANRGLSTVLVGCTGEILFASGLLDLLGVHPMEENRILGDPWAGIETLVQDIPRHPYARVKKEDIRNAFEEVLVFFEKSGLSYYRRENSNLRVLTPLGTGKATYCVPQTMKAGVEALENRYPCLLIDIPGLKGFSARQINTVLQKKWPGLRTASVAFPESEIFRDIYAERLAMALELPKNRDAFARSLRPHIKDARAIGLPAILGIHRTAEVASGLEKAIDAPVFEIPTLPPSVPGMRIKDRFEGGLSEKGVRLILQERVSEVRPGPHGDYVSRIGNSAKAPIVRSKGIILASGRFLGRGLTADRRGVRETLLDLPVFQPETRRDWHRDDFLDPRGHPINRAGLEIDDDFRVTDASGRPVFQGLFAAGSILAHQDWIRMQCGSGLAIATAFGAVQAFIRNCV